MDWQPSELNPVVIASTAVTPVVLTYNEAPNIGRTLETLQWAARVVVVDSGSTDATEQIARHYENVEWRTRSFDRHEAQWRFAIDTAAVDDGYLLALDADHQVPAPFVTELESSFLRGGYSGGIAGFEYRLLGHSIGTSLYPPRVVLFKPSALIVAQPGHTQEFSVTGPTYSFRARLVHDDRKKLERFVESQLRYAELERARLSSGHKLRWTDRLRRSGAMPAIAGLAAFFRAGGPFGGAAALRYAYERVTFECLLAIHLLNEKLHSIEQQTSRQPAGSRDRSGRHTPGWKKPF